MLKPDPVHARSDTPKKLKALCLKCCRFERYERPNFFTVSEPSCGRYSVCVCTYFSECHAHARMHTVKHTSIANVCLCTDIHTYILVA